MGVPHSLCLLRLEMVAQPPVYLSENCLSHMSVTFKHILQPLNGEKECFIIVPKLKFCCENLTFVLHQAKCTASELKNFSNFALLPPKYCVVGWQG